MQLVTTPDTDLLFFDRPFVQGYIIPFVSHMSVELVQFMSQLLNLVMFIQIFMLSLLKINAVDSERTFLFLLRLHTVGIQTLCYEN